MSGGGDAKEAKEAKEVVVDAGVGTAGRFSGRVLAAGAKSWSSMTYSAHDSSSTRWSGRDRDAVEDSCSLCVAADGMHSRRVLGRGGVPPPLLLLLRGMVWLLLARVLPLSASCSVVLYGVCSSR